MRDLDLDVTRDRIKASSATLKLFTYLPHVTTCLGSLSPMTTAANGFISVSLFLLSLIGGAAR